MNDDNTPAEKPFGRPRDAQVHEAILTATLDIFIDEGFDGLTFDKVAKRARSTRAAIYRRWDSKIDMLVEALGRLREKNEAELGAWHDLTLEEVVPWMLKTIPQIAGQDRMTRLLARFIGATPDHPELMEAYRAAYLGPRRQAFSRLLTDAKERGVLPADADTEILQDMYAGALIARMYMATPPNEAQMSDYAERLFRQLGWVR